MLKVLFQVPTTNQLANQRDVGQFSFNLINAFVMYGDKVVKSQLRKFNPKLQ